MTRMNHQEFGVHVAAWHRHIRKLARRLACGDEALAEDLEQEGYIALWECQPGRAYQNQAGYLYHVLRDHMLDAARREHRRRVITPEVRPSGRARRKRTGDMSTRRNMVPRHWNAAPELDASG